VIAGNQRSLDRRADPPVEPGSGVEREQTLDDAGPQPSRDPPAVAFRAELVLIQMPGASGEGSAEPTRKRSLGPATRAFTPSGCPTDPTNRGVMIQLRREGAVPRVVAVVGCWWGLGRRAGRAGGGKARWPAGRKSGKPAAAAVAVRIRCRSSDTGSAQRPGSRQFARLCGGRGARRPGPPWRFAPRLGSRSPFEIINDHDARPRQPMLNQPAPAGTQRTQPAPVQFWHCERDQAIWPTGSNANCGRARAVGGLPLFPSSRHGAGWWCSRRLLNLFGGWPRGCFQHRMHIPVTESSVIKR
jgi:hypothetical protein